jgi:glyoxylase-like metal-dependent hydrolase (beta-lactamase superfamily II)
MKGGYLVGNTFFIGELEVLVVSDGYAKFPATLYFQGTTEQDWEPHKQWLDHEGNAEFPFSCFLVRTGDRRVLIDTGLGIADMWQFEGGALLGLLAGAGVRPEDVDTVFVTHLHVDHCGNCVAANGDAYKAAFPNATYRWSADEDAHWRAAELPPGTKFSIRAMLETLDGRIETADDGATIAPGITVIATPGHTPGHAGVVLSSGTERAYILGDAIACPAQLSEPEWSGLGDMDKALARRTQETVLKEIESDGALLATAHFPGLTFGRVLTGEGKRYWSPMGE